MLLLNSVLGKLEHNGKLCKMIIVNLINTNKCRCFFLFETLIVNVICISILMC